jgi:serpin B
MRLIILMLAIGLIGCGHNPPAAGEDSPDISGLAERNNRFAFDLYQQLSPDHDNILFSPYSLFNALAMTLAGADGNTEKQMEMTLSADMGKRRLFAAFSAMNKATNEMNRQPGISVLCANGIWTQAGHPFKKAFLKRAAGDFDAEIRQVDFVTGFEYQRQQINAWVEDKTKHKIEDLLPAGVPDPQTRMILVNAIYFKGDWQVPFEGQMTREMPFWLTPDRSVNVPLMCRQGPIRYARDEYFQMIELPYEGKNISMLVLLGHPRADIKAIGKMLTADYVNSLYQIMNEFEVRVFLPGFKVVEDYSLSDTLVNMGMTDAFDDRADFSGMNGSKGLYINDVVHKAVIEVNEKGAEAAAATGVVMRKQSAAFMGVTFKADHPFVFLIRENATGAILFLGRLSDPI